MRAAGQEVEVAQLLLEAKASSSRSAQSADCSTKAEGDSHQAGADCAVPAKIAASKRARLIVSVNTAL